MSARRAMIHRCTVYKDATAGQRDVYGGPVAPDWRLHVAGQPCYYYEPRVTVREGLMTDGGRVATVYAHQALVPPDTDLAVGDRLGDLADRRGVALTALAFTVTAIVRRRGHLLVTLEAVA